MKSEFTDENPVRSPCTGTCSTLLGDTICQGCYRTVDEIMLWHKLDNTRKKAIISRTETQKQP